MFTDPEAQKRATPDVVEDEQPAKFMTLPAAPPTWQSASLTPTPPLQTNLSGLIGQSSAASFGTPTGMGGRGRPVGMGMPDDPISPGPGAGLEEVRVWTRRCTLRLGGHRTTLLTEFHLQKVQLNRLQAEAGRTALLEQRIVVLENQPG